MLPQGDIFELPQRLGHRWRGFLHIRKPVVDMFYFLERKVICLSWNCKDIMK